MINAFLDSGLVPTASLPIGTEMKNRLTAKNTAALSSSIHIVCRKMEKEGAKRFSEVKEEIREKIFNNDFLEHGFVGPDFLAACMGLATSVFARYEKVIDDDGSIVRADKLLKFVREVTTDYMVKHTLYGEIAEKISPLTKFYILWRQTFRNTRIKLDKAQSLAQSVGIDLFDESLGKGFIKKENGYVKVLGPQERKVEEIESLKNKDLIDILHLVLLFWSQGKMSEVKKVLVESGFTNDEVFYKVAQAISETLSSSNKEKKLIDSFLSIKDKLLMEINKIGGF